MPRILGACPGSRGDCLAVAGGGGGEVGGRGGVCNRIFLAVGGEEPDENLVLKMAERREPVGPQG